MQKIVILLIILILFTFNVNSSDLSSYDKFEKTVGTYKVTLAFPAYSYLNQGPLVSLDGKKIIQAEGDLKRDIILQIRKIDGSFYLYRGEERLSKTPLRIILSKGNVKVSLSFIVNDLEAQNIYFDVSADAAYNDKTGVFDIFEKRRASLKYDTGMSSSILGTATTFQINKVTDSKIETTRKSETLQQMPRGLTFVKGIVQIKRAGSDNWIKATKYMQLEPGDVIRTGKNSRADIGMQTSEFAPAAGSDIRLGPLSYLTIPDDTLKIERKSNVRVVVDDIIKNIYKTFGKNEFEVETPSTEMSVRGTDFIVEVDEDGNTEIFLNEGLLSVRSKYNNASITLNSGQKVYVPKESAMQPQQTMSLAEKKTFSEEALQKEKENLLMRAILHWMKLVSELK
jgi:hypothetical protein